MSQAASTTNADPSPSASGATDTAIADCERYQSEIRLLRTQLAGSEDEIRALKRRIRSLEAQVKRLKQASADQTAEIERLREELAEKAAHVGALETELSEKTAEVASLQDEVAAKDAAIVTLTDQNLAQAVEVTHLKALLAASEAKLATLEHRAEEAEGELEEAVEVEALEDKIQAVLDETDPAERAKKIAALSPDELAAYYDKRSGALA